MPATHIVRYTMVPRPEYTDRGWLVVLSRRRISIVSVPLDITARTRAETLQVSPRAEGESTMLQGQHLRKSYGAVTVISDVSFILNDHQHVGLTGPNGVGKSTLLRCLTGAEHLDAGTIVKSPPDLSIGYLTQSIGDLGERSVGEVVA